MKNINWRVRFSTQNKTFLFRVALGAAMPILGYFGLRLEDLTTWGAVFGILAKALNNPYVLGLIVVNVLNLIPDPTTKGWSDSTRALGYDKPKEG